MASTETTPLLSNGAHKTKTAASLATRSIFGPANRILLAGFLMAFTLGITQVPIIYALHIMECDVFYGRHPPFDGPGDRCNRWEINAGAATQLSLIGMTTSFSGVLNLFVCGYLIKAWGQKWAFVSQTSLLGLRVSTQILAVALGGRAGITIFQTTQLIGVLGGPRGYQLVLNTAVSEVVSSKDRTAVFGMLQGSLMLGTAFGFLLGGVLGDTYGISRPFETAFFLYIVSSVYGALFMPTASSNNSKEEKQNGQDSSGFFAPLRVIVPRKYVLEDGKVITNYGLIFLALGIFLGVFASGYAPTILQMYAAAEFHFSTTENGWLMFGNSLIRGLFLIFAFPKIISMGRKWYSHQPHDSGVIAQGSEVEEPTDSAGLAIAVEGGVLQEAVDAPEAEEEEEEEDTDTGFDLLFVRWSLVVDSIVTALAGFSRQGWQAYLAACLLPLASGSAPAAKGVMTELTPPDRRQDAISAITLVESAAMLTTQGLFGLIFAGFSQIGKPSLTFFCNAGFALLGVFVLFMARFPPPKSKPLDQDADGDVIEIDAENETL